MEIKGQYKLKRYVWRSLLTLVGPLLIVAFYAYICFAILVHPALNGIVPYVSIDARWLFYIWFLLAVFILDWSRTGLANIEAAALMHPRLAPSTAVQLMWHVDNKWANPIWWLKAVRAILMNMSQNRKSRDRKASQGPGYLWGFLSATFFILFVSLPLSGLTMEFTQILIYTDELAPIFGPNSSNFNTRSYLNLPTQIRTNWQSGRLTNPPNGSLIYAPSEYKGVPPTYFHSQATKHVDYIESFVGPSAHEPVAGIAWGVWSNISCRPIPKEDLRMLQIHGLERFNFSLNGCLQEDISHECQPRWQTNLSSLDSRGARLSASFPLWLNETATSDESTWYWFAAAADGYFDPYRVRGSPYIRDSNHDNATFDSAVDGKAQEKMTTAMIEMFLGELLFFTDEVMDQLVNGTIKDPVMIDQDTNGYYYAGIAVHCDVTSTSRTA